MQMEMEMAHQNKQPVALWERCAKPEETSSLVQCLMEMDINARVLSAFLPARMDAVRSTLLWYVFGLGRGRVAASASVRARLPLLGCFLR